MTKPVSNRHHKSGFKGVDLVDISSGDEDKPQSFGWTCVRLSSSALCGMVFGFVLEKGRVFEPQVIRDQMLFTRFVMLKMFLGASATSMFSFSILTMVPSTHKYLAHATREFTSGFGNKGVLSSIIGGALLGTGMTLSGSCPGLVAVQVGTGTENAVYTVLGGLSGVVLYALLEPTVVKATRPTSPIQQHFLHQHVGGPFFGLALPFVAMLGMVTFAAELYAPWASEVPVGGEGILTALSWPPYVAGVVVGLLQIPVVLINRDSLGCSTGFCTVMSQCFRGPSKLQSLCPYLSSYRSGANNWWQVLYFGGTVAGGYMASYLGGSVGGPPGVPPMAAFLGGACMLFGARMAAGCTSGHGLSGMGMLSLLSLVTVPAMFAGGVATVVLMTKV